MTVFSLFLRDAPWYNAGERTTTEDMLMDGLQWVLQRGTETLLLVAVDPSAADTPGAWPCRVVGEFSPRGAAALPPAEDAARITRLLSDIGVPTNLLGYAYLRTALTLLLAEPALGRCISRGLYPRIALEHHTAPAGVERAIRHAIAQTFSRGGSAGYRAALGRLASSVGDRPTNSEFLAQTAERLRLGA